MPTENKEVVSAAEVLRTITQDNQSLPKNDVEDILEAAGLLEELSDENNRLNRQLAMCEQALAQCRSRMYGIALLLRE